MTEIEAKIPKLRENQAKTGQNQSLKGFWQGESKEKMRKNVAGGCGLGLGLMLRFSVPRISGEISPKFPGVVPCGEGRRPERIAPSPVSFGDSDAEIQRPKVAAAPAA